MAQKGIFLILTLLPALVLGQLSKYLTICKHDDPNLNECVSRSAEKLFRSAVGGMREFGIPSTDPLPIPRMSLDQGLGTGGLFLTFTDTKIYGLSGIKVTSMRNVPDEYILEATGTVDVLSIVGDYDIKGRILLLPITGNGFSNITYENSDITLRVKGEPIQKKGKTYMKVTNVKLTVEPRSGAVQLDNLFNGNRQLGDTMNKFLNENFVEVIKELGPTISEALSALFKGLGERIYNKVPYDELYPSS